MKPRWSFENGPEGGVLVIRKRPYGRVQVLAGVLVLGVVLGLGHKVLPALLRGQAEAWRLLMPLVAVGVLAKKMEGWVWHAFGQERLEAGFSQVRYTHGIGRWCESFSLPRNEFRGLFVLAQPPEYWAKNWARRWVAPRLGLAKVGDEYHQIGFGLSEEEADAFFEDLQRQRGDWVYRAPR